MIASQVCGIQSGNSRNLTQKRAFPPPNARRPAGRPLAAHLELSPPSEYIQQDGSVPSVTHSAESIRLGNVRRSDASPPLVPREAAATCARAVVHPAQHVHLTCPDPPGLAAPAEPLLPPSIELMNKCMKCHPENRKWKGERSAVYSKYCAIFRKYQISFNLRFAIELLIAVVLS